MRGLLPDNLLTFHLILGALFGLILGSFLNVCIYRIPRDLSIVWPRSFCPECGQSIRWQENIPVLSFLALRGRCSCCSQSIGVRYPAVEILTGAVFATIAYKYSFTLVAGKWCVFEALLIVLFWTDMEERILPDELTIGGALAGAGLSFLVSVPGFLGDLFFPDRSEMWRSFLNMSGGAVLLSIPVWVAGALYSKMRRRTALGFGDVKLLVLLGVFLGPDKGIMALLLGSVGGSAVGLAHVLVTRKDPR